MSAGNDRRGRQGWRRRDQRGGVLAHHEEDVALLRRPVRPGPALEDTWMKNQGCPSVACSVFSSRRSSSFVVRRRSSSSSICTRFSWFDEEEESGAFCLLRVCRINPHLFFSGRRRGWLDRVLLSDVLWFLPDDAKKAESVVKFGTGRANLLERWDASPHRCNFI